MLIRITRRLRRGEEGFTLIELLVVVAIIALLATFAAPRLFDAINKSKKAPGQADLQTISSALERYYMDNNAYPADLDSLKNTYLKSTTTFKNGFSKGYFYGTTAGGTSYVVVDPVNVGSIVSGICGSAVDWTPGAAAVSNATLTDAEITACATPANMSLVKS